ncbi:MAG: hypothetical protein ACYC91_20150 [Solirubrobacteraceae bacterium]
MSRPARLIIAAAFAAAIVCWVPPTIAAEAGAQFGYSISAVGSSSYFIFDALPGRAVTGTLRIHSLTPAGKTILVSPVDVGTAADGGLQYGSAAPHGDGRWLNLAEHSVHLSGTRSADVRFTVVGV